MHLERSPCEKAASAWSSVEVRRISAVKGISERGVQLLAERGGLLL